MYPLVIGYIAIENTPVIVNCPIRNVFFHSYVSLPEGTMTVKQEIHGIPWGFRWLGGFDSTVALQTDPS